MSRPGTDRLKVNPPLGMMPSLQYLPPAMLRIDATYQRSMDSDQSRTLVRSIAQYWNWDLCQPLVVARREDGGLFVIDGQHRLEAARLRGDIAQLPAVVVQYANAADEAASFVQLNQARRPLTKMDLFKAAVASGDSEAVAILAAIGEAGLSVAPHFNRTSWKPGMIDNIGGVEACWRRSGPVVTRLALKALGEAWPGQILGYAGTMFPGIAAVVAVEVAEGPDIVPVIWAEMIGLFGGETQATWRGKVMQARADDPNLKYVDASVRVFRDAWAVVVAGGFDRVDDAPAQSGVGAGGGAPPATPSPKEEGAHRPGFDWLKPAGPVAAKPAAKVESERGRAPAINWGKLSVAAGAARPAGKTWCKQCDRRKTWPEIDKCRDRHCSFGAKS